MSASLFVPAAYLDDVAPYPTFAIFAQELSVLANQSGYGRDFRPDAPNGWTKTPEDE